VFLGNTKQWWALIVGGILVLVSLSFIVATDVVKYVTPIALILVGGGILVRQITRRDASEPSESPSSET
jgi:cytochrome c-type biogenesis protein CcmH/NrfF